jgi:hypothetical protein
MKLKSTTLSSYLSESLRELGYIEFRDKCRVADCLFIKPCKCGFYLSLGFTISDYFENRFTADYYLSKVTVWAATWGDIPTSCYQRVGSLLTIEERERYLDAEFRQTGRVDAWWSTNQPNMLQDFVNVVKVTEDRFLKTPGLLEQLSESSEIQELVAQSSRVIDIVSQKTIAETEQMRFPLKYQISEDWFIAAESVLKDMGSLINSKVVARLAADSWRQACLRYTGQMR